MDGEVAEKFPSGGGTRRVMTKDGLAPKPRSTHGNWVAVIKMLEKVRWLLCMVMD